MIEKSPPDLRELDSALAKQLFGLNVVHEHWPCGYTPDDCDLEADPFWTHLKPMHSRYDDQIDDWGPVYVPNGGRWPPEPAPWRGQSWQDLASASWSGPSPER